MNHPLLLLTISTSTLFQASKPKLWVRPYCSSKNACLGFGPTNSPIFVLDIIWSGLRRLICVNEDFIGHGRQLFVSTSTGPDDHLFLRPRSLIGQSLERRFFVGVGDSVGWVADFDFELRCFGISAAAGLSEVGLSPEIPSLQVYQTHFKSSRLQWNIS